MTKLQRVREHRAITRAELAERANVDISTITAIEKGGRVVTTAGAVSRIARALDTDVTAII